MSTISSNRLTVSLGEFCFILHASSLPRAMLQSATTYYQNEETRASLEE